jgi:hypothetical protein
VRKFGLDEESRKTKLEAVLNGQINTLAKDAIVKQNAYDLLANQNNVQTALETSLRQVMKDQMWLNLESIQIIGRPDFVDDRIEQAGSAVVAATKDQEAAQARLNAAQIASEQKRVEAQVFANPAALKIRELELQLNITQALADGIKGHQGTLILGSSPGGMQLQIPAGNK